ncbi:hypothetical protein [Tsukamurella paurometabola]|uniref:Uncharacterized protein n=1 Tax=Tsukamurella paurometabola TaxID=2061 RepID=A0A3P8L3S1_TSUPA|nr:hypothetical protein [Tsukamurella paurometabola]UEA84436.1 hypothetical protein LK411_06330 [Tsukamurella paurometabola]VDR37001.1 Uncharacterised protein [Tsukamurella paurometabola]
MTAPQDLLAHGRMQRDDAMPPNRVVLAAAKRLQQACELVLDGTPATDLTVDAPPWDDVPAEQRETWLWLARVALGVES